MRVLEETTDTSECLLRLSVSMPTATRQQPQLHTRLIAAADCAVVQIASLVCVGGLHYSFLQSWEVYHSAHECIYKRMMHAAC
mmetsp:Transcript_8374/g.16179  ORF Transcript_8374/g.16179 Transcript_8374/m.16179 type:complete len:83 (+) Transcript_8374:432-680(+)